MTGQGVKETQRLNTQTLITNEEQVRREEGGGAQRRRPRENKADRQRETESRPQRTHRHMGHENPNTTQRKQESGQPPQNQE